MGKFFSIAEMAKSDTAERLGINNRIPKEVLPNVQNLITKVLDPLRAHYGKPITVNSGYRCPELNKAVGGSATSDHLQGRAADITGGSRAENEKLFDLIQALGLPFDQLIDEKDFSWVHVSYRGVKENRKQVLKL